MITTVTLNPAIDREYFVDSNHVNSQQHIYQDQNIRITPGGKGLLSAINFKNLGYTDVQNIGFIGGKQGLILEKMVQEYQISTNYIYTDSETRNNIFIIGKEPITYTCYNDYTYQVQREAEERLIKRFKKGIVDSELIMISGSIPKGINNNIYQRLIQLCHQADKEVYLHACGPELNKALAEKPKIVKPYFKHCDQILEQKVDEFKDYIKAGSRLQQAGAKYAIVPYHLMRLIFIEKEIYLLSSPDIRAQNWLGASEAYNTAFFDYILQNEFDFLAANKYAFAAFLAVAEKKDIFIQDRIEIKNKLAQIKIKKIGG